jgi:hypothetical protein
MRHLLLTLVLLAPIAVYGQVASPFSFYVHDTTGTTPDTPLPAAYQLAETPVGGSSPTVLKMVNSSQNTVFFVVAVMSVSTTSEVANPDFSVTGLFADYVLPPGGDLLFSVNFVPSVTGTLTGFLNVEFQISQSGCSFTSSVNACPSGLVNVSTMTGIATAPLLTLSYQTSSGPVVLAPASASPLNFPNTSLSATSTITFTLTNQTAVDTPTPAISLPTVDLNAPSAFTLDTSTLPTTIAAGQSANFSVTFAPGQTGYADAILQIGSNTYPLAGEGIIIADIDQLQITYTNSTGVRTSPQAATPITFAQVVPGSGASAVLAFNVLNPSTATDPVTLNSITVSGAAFSLSNVPTAPIVIAVGASISFNLTFTPNSSGTFTGTLSIGTRVFTVSAVGVASPVPAFNLTLASPIASQQQAALMVQFSSPSTVAAIGTITLQFAPSIVNVADDAAVVFLATGGRQLNIDVAAGAQTATYNGQTAITFQTGTTAGTVTFSVAFPDTPTYSQSFTIAPAAVQLTTVQASAESPNLIVTMTGYDNTYSAGQLSFTFHDTSGKAIGSPIQFNAATNFQGLFFTNNTMGGMFSLQASFPVTGDVTQVGSVTAEISNSAGQSTSNATFQ